MARLVGATIRRRLIVAVDIIDVGIGDESTSSARVGPNLLL